ncbi:hypothetical protein V8C44DRAFT_334314 [Trichoderma aethiopicum]
MCFSVSWCWFMLCLSGCLAIWPYGSTGEAGEGVYDCTVLVQYLERQRGRDARMLAVEPWGKPDALIIDLTRPFYVKLDFAFIFPRSLNNSLSLRSISRITCSNSFFYLGSVTFLPPRVSP